MTAAERIGVFAEPELEFRYLSPNDTFLIIASDGVFEFISSQRVVDMVRDAGGRKQHLCLWLSQPISILKLQAFPPLLVPWL